MPSRSRYAPEKMKVASVESDLPRGKVIRSVVDDPANLPEGWKPEQQRSPLGEWSRGIPLMFFPAVPPSASSIEGKNAGLCS